MSEVNTQETTAVEQETRKFTQDELNAIVEDRLSRERRKYADYEELKAKAGKYTELEESQKSELQKVTEKADALQRELDNMNKAESIRKLREKVSQDTGVPASLLSGEDEDSMQEQAKAIMEFAKPMSRNYPQVKDGGEVTGGAGITKADILAIKDERARIKAIQDNIDLFK